MAAHLGLAMLLLGGLLWLCRSGQRRRRATDGGPRVRALWRSPRAWRCSARSWPAATWPGRRTTGAPDYQLGDGAHHACGKEFPTCNGDFMPFGKARLVDIHLTHRAFMYLASLLVIAPRGRCDPARGADAATRWGLAGAARACRSWSAR